MLGFVCSFLNSPRRTSSDSPRVGEMGQGWALHLWNSLLLLIRIYPRRVWNENTRSATSMKTESSCCWAEKSLFLTTYQWVITGTFREGEGGKWNRSLCHPVLNEEGILTQRFLVSSTIGQATDRDLYLKFSVHQINHYYACTYPGGMVRQFVCRTWAQGALMGCTRASGLSWDMSEINSMLLATWRQGGKINPFVSPKGRKKVTCGWLAAIHGAAAGLWPTCLAVVSLTKCQFSAL